MTKKQGYYLRARYYDPKLGRFINEDTYEGQINNPLTLNVYTYCINNPMIYHDPSGHENKYIGGEAGGGGVDPVSLGYILLEGVKGIGKGIFKFLGIGVATYPVYATVENITSSENKNDTKGASETEFTEDPKDF